MSYNQTRSVKGLWFPTWMKVLISLLPYSWPAKLYKTMSGLQTWTFIVFLLNCKIHILLVFTLSYGSRVLDIPSKSSGFHLCFFNFQSRFSFFYLTWETRHSTSRFSHSLLLAFDLFRSEINLSKTRSIMFHNTIEMIPNNANWMVMLILPSEASVGATLYWNEQSLQFDC